MARAFVIVIDACGVGELPDSGAYGDAGANTLVHLANAAGGLSLPTLGALGLGRIVELPGVPPAPSPVLHGRLAPLGPGKDSTAGHWELMGVVVAKAPPTFPDGLPEELVVVVADVFGARPLCCAPHNGVEAIEEFGAEAVASGRVILYTSQDSVLQLAAHVDVVAPERLYERCARLRAVLSAGEARFDVGRVIARPFTGTAGGGGFERTLGRRDFGVPPPGPSYLEALQAAGVVVHGVGKVTDLFAGVGIDVAHPGASNAATIASVEALIDSLDSGLVFANLIETDQVFGHRKDVAGFHQALRTIDAAVGRWLELLRGDDLLVLTADHGVDPAAGHSDHTREYVPLLARFRGDGGRRHDGVMADVGASALRWLTGRDAPELPGAAFVAGYGGAGSGSGAGSGPGSGPGAGSGRGAGRGGDA